jgi:hypothetical protein
MGTQDKTTSDALATAMRDYGPARHEVMSSRGGEPKRLRFTGTLVTSGNGLGVYELTGGRVLVVFEDGWQEFVSVEDFGAWVYDTPRDQLDRVTEHVLGEAANMLGVSEVIDLDEERS